MTEYTLITSRNNEKIKNAAALKNAGGKKSGGLFLLEGIRLCSDALSSRSEIKELFFTQSAFDKYSEKIKKLAEKSESVFMIDTAVSEKLSDTKTPQGVYCVCKPVQTNPVIRKDGYYILTDNIQNPDNIGAIVRTAEALGFEGLFVLGGCDIYAPKAMRASMGGFLRFPVQTVTDAKEIASRLSSVGVKLLATVPDACATKITDCNLGRGNCLVIGNEGNGICEEVMSLCDMRVTIPMAGKAESLNASSAATIAMWEIARNIK